ncbi:hypothetical protein JOF29_005307 [Kribbella aluminosa]|uniref:DUF559 domain-containing protein n=1 Tax=Kribbella aluminosa TaxID=416017 RepID=A0ABS4URD1_9ACTN|nr:hypothetical protein [Kribbella aluminosa]MBP2354197.1 hypothetical protein [Kribbella aluminosa]
MLVTVAQARGAGISRGVLRGPRYRRVLGSTYVEAQVAVTPRLRAEAALALTPGAVVSHHTAFGLWTADDRPTDDGVVHLTVERDPHRVLPRVDGLRVHEVQHLDRVLREGLPLTPPDRTFLDLAPYHDLTGLVTAGDSLVRRTDLEPERLIDLTTAAIGVRGVRLAREAAALVRRGVDSPMESRLRLLLVLSGLPEPQVGYVVSDPAGGWLAQPDLSYPEIKFGIEYDGQHHLVDAHQWRQDIRRRENMEREGWLVRVITAHDLFQIPQTVVARISQDLYARHHPLLAA